MYFCCVNLSNTVMCHAHLLVLLTQGRCSEQLSARESTDERSRADGKGRLRGIMGKISRYTPVSGFNG